MWSLKSNRNMPMWPCACACLAKPVCMCFCVPVWACVYAGQCVCEEAYRCVQECGQTDLWVTQASPSRRALSSFWLPWQQQKASASVNKASCVYWIRRRGLGPEAKTGARVLQQSVPCHSWPPRTFSSLGRQRDTCPGVLWLWGDITQQEFQAVASLQSTSFIDLGVHKIEIILMLT